VVCHDAFTGALVVGICLERKELFVRFLQVVAKGLCPRFQDRVGVHPEFRVLANRAEKLALGFQVFLNLAFDAVPENLVLFAQPFADVSRDIGLVLVWGDVELGDEDALFLFPDFLDLLYGIGLRQHSLAIALRVFCELRRGGCSSWVFKWLEGSVSIVMC
jgi:hypothetical protein